jgi:hypothetical protein
MFNTPITPARVRSKDLPAQSKMGIPMRQSAVSARRRGRRWGPPLPTRRC